MKPTSQLLVILLLLSASMMKAQDVWHHIEGLPCEEVACITQCHDGYMWIGTRLGLIRYDGYTIKEYRNDISHPYVFSSCNIRSLASDADGHVFAGSFFGLNSLYLKTQETEITHFEGNDYVNVVLHDRHDRLWAGTGHGLYLRSAKKAFRYYPQIPHDLIMSLSETTDGAIIVVTGKSGIFRIDTLGHCTAIKASDALKPSTAIAGTGDTLWVGTRGKGLYSICNDEITCHPGYEGYVVNDLLVSPNNHRLLLATDKGVAYYPDRDVPASLPGKSVQDLCTDNYGNIWAATETDGVYRMSGNKSRFVCLRRAFTSFTSPIVSQFNVQHLGDTTAWKTIPGINAIYENADGTTFVGTQSNGIYIVKDGQVLLQAKQSNTPWLRTNTIFAFGMLGPDSILVATWQGLYVMDITGSGHFVGKVGESDVCTMHTLAINTLTEGDIWLGLVGGIAHIELGSHNLSDARITVYTHVNKQGETNVGDIGKLTNSHDETGDYQLGGIYRIVRDRKGRIWACTSEPGLLLYDEEGDMFRCVSQQLGIIGDNVHSMDIDRYGSYWMTTNYGLLQLTLDDDVKIIQKRLYTQNDGLPSNYYGSTMSTLLADGKICLLNQQQLITITPTRKFGVLAHQTSRISDILVNGSIPIIDSEAEYNAAPPYLNHIVLPHHQNSVTIRFTSLSFGHEPSVSYRYRLEGFDRSYQFTDMGTNTVSYNQLPPGCYTLYYCSTDGNNEHEACQALEIEILQPIWWRWWARLLYAIVLLSVAYLVIANLIDRKRKRHQLELLTVEKRQQEAFYQKKMQFYTRAFHQLTTPLTLLSDLTHSLHERVRPSLQATLFMLTTQVDKLKDAMSNMADVNDDAMAHEALQKAKEMTRVDQDFLRKCTESVNNHIADADYSHQIMMEEVGASHATLYRKLKALTGMDTTSFIRSIRLRAACQLMKQMPNIRISELAERVGYSNPQYFATCFRKEFGMTPREYMEKNI